MSVFLQKFRSGTSSEHNSISASTGANNALVENLTQFLKRIGAGAIEERDSGKGRKRERVFKVKVTTLFIYMTNQLKCLETSYVTIRSLTYISQMR